MARLQTDQNAAPHAVTGNTVGQVRQSVVVVAVVVRVLGADGDVSDVEENAECAEDDEQYSDDS